jgi:hypothetical protein
MHSTSKLSGKKDNYVVYRYFTWYKYINKLQKREVVNHKLK